MGPPLLNLSLADSEGRVSEGRERGGRGEEGRGEEGRREEREGEEREIALPRGVCVVPKSYRLPPGLFTSDPDTGW